MGNKRGRAVNYPQVFTNFGWKLNIIGKYTATASRKMESGEVTASFSFPFAQSCSLVELSEKCDEWDEKKWAADTSLMLPECQYQDVKIIANAIKSELKWLSAALVGEDSLQDSDDEKAFAEAFHCSGLTPDQY